jgi:hypothetical protein
VDQLRLKDEVHEGRAIDLLDVRESPIVTHGRSLYWPRMRRLSLRDRFVPSYAPEYACPV